MVGKIIAVSDLVIEILLNNDDKVIIKDILVANYKDREYRFEVVEISGFVAKAIALDSVIYLKKGIPLYKKNTSLDIEYSDQILGKVDRVLPIISPINHIIKSQAGFFLLVFCPLVTVIVLEPVFKFLVPVPLIVASVSLAIAPTDIDCLENGTVPIL